LFGLPILLSAAGATPHLANQASNLKPICFEVSSAEPRAHRGSVPRGGKQATKARRALLNMSQMGMKS